MGVFNLCDKAASALMTVFGFLSAVVINLITVPLSLLYTAVTETLSDRWKLDCEAPGVYYIWWSFNCQCVKCSCDSSFSGVHQKFEEYTILSLVVFDCIAPWILLCAALKRLSSAIILTFKDNGEESGSEKANRSRSGKSHRRRNTRSH